MGSINQRSYACSVSGGVCEVCGKVITPCTGQMAHRIGNTLKNRKRYGDLIIDHILNVGMTCSLKCNAELDISCNLGECIKLCEVIYCYEASKFRS